MLRRSKRDSYGPDEDLEVSTTKKGNIIAVEKLGRKKDVFWEVESVVGRRIQGGGAQYLIKWKGYSNRDNTWEPEENLSDSAICEAEKYMNSIGISSVCQKRST
ncbi:hypothetical protein TrCOL_g3329 [Triparma columacea]|uniref:Chromo domain-containing protein n=1 Tax=Triparma columacea TaxID=722753 RepID=A0A9W7LCW6_9STRA|nr:hypothetical protein TrCOL_g3329 [Triparma columacea]